MQAIRNMFFKLKNVHVLYEDKDVTVKSPSFKILENNAPCGFFIFTKSEAIILQNWVDCLEVTYEAICFKYTAT